MTFQRTRRLYSIALPALVSVAAIASLEGQQRRQGGPPPYDVSQEMTVSGTVIGLEVVTPPNQPEPQAMLMATVNGVRTAVFLGPDSWVKQQNVPLAAGSTVQITGLEGYRFNGIPAMTPRVIRAGSRALTLRDALGRPLWEPLDSGRRSAGN